MNQYGEQRMDKSKRESMKWFFFVFFSLLFPQRRMKVEMKLCELTLSKVG